MDVAHLVIGCCASSSNERKIWDQKDSGVEVFKKITSVAVTTCCTQLQLGRRDEKTRV